MTKTVLAKKVKYNGGTGSYYGCTEPNELTKNQIYTIENEMEIGPYQTNYILTEVDGEFNSSWFDDVEISDRVFIGISYEKPVCGMRYTLYKLEPIMGITNRRPIRTSTIKSILLLGNSIYMLYTKNSIYIVQVMNND